VVFINEESHNVLITVWNVKLAVELHCVNDAEEVGSKIESKQHFLVVVTECRLWSLRCRLWSRIQKRVNILRNNDFL